MKNNKYLEKCIEYSIYHDNYEKKSNLPGLKKGLPEKNFFKKREYKNLNDCENIFKNILNNEIEKIDNYSMFVSGGVDSSILLGKSVELKKNFLAIHTSYKNHNLNDINKLNKLKEFYKFNCKIVEITTDKYFKGMENSWKKKYYGNIYSPTLYYSLTNDDKKILITGSGPDELFYGMEKYSIKLFKKLRNINLIKALEKIDYCYNKESYLKVLNKKGLEILNKIEEKRRNLYLKISEIYDDILDAQRLLAYCTVTNQHLEMFNQAAASVNKYHVAPFLREEIIKFAFSFKLNDFLIKSTNLDDANIGKFHLKKILEKMTNKKHAYDKKIGFHAPISKFFSFENKIFVNSLKKLNYDNLSVIINIDLLKKRIQNEQKNLKKDYFFYSLINLDRILKNNN
jgi:asparagine synthetase B (glutamine-hydrolysing)